MASLPDPLSLLNPGAQLLPAQAALNSLSTPEPPAFPRNLDDASMLQVAGPSSTTSSTSNLDPGHEFSVSRETHKMVLSSLAEMQTDVSYKSSSISNPEAYGAEGVLSLESARLSLKCLGNGVAHDKKRAMNRFGSRVTPGDELLGYSIAQPSSSVVALGSNGRHGSKQTLYPKSSAFASLTLSSDRVPSSGEQTAAPTQSGDSRRSGWHNPAPTMKLGSSVSKHIALPHRLDTTTEPLLTVKATPSFSSSTATESDIPLIVPVAPLISRASAPVMQIGCNMPDQDPALQLSQSSARRLNQLPAFMIAKQALYSSLARPLNSPFPPDASTSLSALMPTASPRAIPCSPSLNGTALSRNPAEMISDLQIDDSSLSVISPMPTVQHIPFKSDGGLLPTPITLERPLPASITSVSSPSLGKLNPSTGFTSSYPTRHNSSSISSFSSDTHRRNPSAPYAQHSLQSYTFQPYSISTSSLKLTSTGTSPYPHDSPTQTPRHMTMKRLLAKPAPPSPSAIPPVGYAGYANGFGGVISGDIQNVFSHSKSDGSENLKEQEIGFAVFDLKRRKKRSGKEGDRNLTMQPPTSSPTPFFTAEHQVVVRDHLPMGDVDKGQELLSTDTTVAERSYSEVPMSGCSGTEIVNDHEEDKPTQNVLRRRRSNVRTSKPQTSRDNTYRTGANRISVHPLLSHGGRSLLEVRKANTDSLRVATESICDHVPTEQVHADIAGNASRHFRMPYILSRSRSNSFTHGASAFHSTPSLNPTGLNGPDMGLSDQRMLTPAASLVEEYKAKEKKKGWNKVENCNDKGTTSPTQGSGKKRRTDRGLRRSASMSLVLSLGAAARHAPDMAIFKAGELISMAKGASDEGYTTGRTGEKLEKGDDVNEDISPKRGGAVEESVSHAPAMTRRFGKTRSGENVGAYDGCTNNDYPPVLVKAPRKGLKQTASLSNRRGVQSDHGHVGSSPPLMQEDDPARIQGRNKQKNCSRMGRERDRRPLRLSIDKYASDTAKEKLRKGVEKANRKSSGGNKFWRLMRRFSISLPRDKRAKTPPPLPTLPSLSPSSLVDISWGAITRPSAQPPPRRSRHRDPDRSTSSRSSSFTSSDHTPSLQALQSTPRTELDAPPVSKLPTASALSLHIVNPNALEIACRVNDRYDDSHPERHKFSNLSAPEIPSPKTPREGDWVRSSSPDIQLSSLPFPPRRTPKPDPEVFSVSSTYSIDEMPMQRYESPIIPSSTVCAVNSFPSHCLKPTVTNEPPISTPPIPSISLVTPEPPLCRMGNPLEPKPGSTRGFHPVIAVSDYSAFPMSNAPASTVHPGNQTQVTSTRRRSLSLADEDPWPSSSSMLVNDSPQLNTFHRSNLTLIPSVVTRPGTANTFGVSGGLGIMVRPGTGGSAFSARSGASTITERGVPLGPLWRLSSTSSFD